MEISNAQLFKLMNEAYNDEDFQVFCMMYFEPVYNNFAGGQSKNAKIMKLIEHCKQHLKMDTLLERIQEERPEQYQKHLGDASSKEAAGEQSTTSSVDTDQAVSVNARFEELLKDQDLRGALVLLEEHAEAKQDQDLKNTVLLQRGRLSAIERDFKQGLVDYNNYKMELVRISQGIQGLLS